MIIRPLLYDIKRTITSKTVLILVAIVLLVSLAIIPLTSPTSRIGFNFPQLPILYYRDNSGYHFLAFSTNDYGDSVNGQGVNITLSTFGVIPYQRVDSETKFTNSSGLAAITFNVPPGNYSVSVELSNNHFPYGNGYISQSTPPGDVSALGSAISFVSDKTNGSQKKVQVFYEGAYGVAPIGYSLHFAWSSSPSAILGNLNENQTVLVGNLTGFSQIFSIPISSGLDPATQVVFELFYPNGTVAQTTYTSYSTLRIPKSPTQVANIASFFFSTILGLVIPLMAIIGSYSSYGKDRLTGVLESILARPVTRRGLAMSRFLSTVAAFTIASAAAVGVVDLVLNSVGGSFLDQSYVLAIIAGLVVEVAAFTGLIFLLSHLLKSTGALLGISIVLFIVLDFFWSLIIFLVTLALGGTGGSFVALQATFYSYYANPAQFLNLINAYVFQSSNTTVQASSLGVTLPAIVLDGLLWTIMPFIIFLYLAVKRD